MIARRKIILLTGLLVIAAAVFLGAAHRWPVLLHGTKENAGETAANPILLSDVPDPDVIRVGNAYYMTSTTMHMNPGVPIMKSTDLVNWKIVNYVYDTLGDQDEQTLRNGKNEYGKGSWASSLKYHNGKYYVSFASYTTNKTYIYQTGDIEKGPWTHSELSGVYRDASLLFDDDGRVYLIHGGGDITATELTADATAVKPGGLNQVIIKNASAAAGEIGKGLVAEGTHAQKINGRYYIFNIVWPEGGIRTEIVHRADRIDGPYEGKVALSDTMGYRNNGVAQGGMVDTPDGKWFAMLFQDHGAVGRVPVLVPVRWKDGWPVFGDKDGKVPLHIQTPGASGFHTELTQSDEFNRTAPNESVLGLQWQWNHNPDNTKWSLTDRKGFLRLTTGEVVPDLLQARNTLTQRGQGPRSSGWISMDTSHMRNGDYAGLAALQQEYGFIGATKQAGKSYIVMVDKGEEKARQPLAQDQVYFKIDFDFTVDKAVFFYSYNGSDWTPFGSELAMRYTIPQFMGYRFALFDYATKTTGGSVDFDFFRFMDDAAGNKTPAVPAAYLKDDAVQLSRDKGSVYELQLLMDEFPKDDAVTQIHAVVHVPEDFAVTGVEPDSANLHADKVAFQPVSGGAELTIRNSDGSAISFANRDAGKVLATIKVQLKQELTKSYQGEITIDNLEIRRSDNSAVSYDVSGAASELRYTPPAAAIGKVPPNGNPLVSYKFGADPYALVYEDRVYLYMTNDVLEYDADGSVKNNTFGNINKIGVISSDDLVNWTDHGEIPVAGPQGAAKWASQSWAPAIAHKVIDGKDKFFLYFANNASGIGVLEGDSPVGPWTDPIGKPLITRSTPGVQDVTWLFDPAVLVDDDGKAYIYFGGGIPQGKDQMPNTARVMQLGPDMTSVVGEAAMIPAPYMFEDSGINKYKGTYYYSYCSNFSGGTRPEGSPPAGEIAYMTSDSPLGPWTYRGTILKNPGHFFGVGGNNHHAMFQFKDQWYITYHAQTLSNAMGVPKGYRSTHLNRVAFNPDGSIQEIQADYQGVPQIRNLRPYTRVEAETIGWSAGVKTEAIAADDEQETSSSNRAVTDIDNGDWIAVSKVDFGSRGASGFTASVSSGGEGGVMELRLDGADGKLIGTLPVPAADDSDWTELTTNVSGAEGVHDLYLVFRGRPDAKLFKLDYWKFRE